MPSAPFVNVNVPLTVSLFASVTPVPLLIVRLLKVTAPVAVCALDPLKTMVPEFAVNVPPEKVKLPPMSSVPVPSANAPPD